MIPSGPSNSSTGFSARDVVGVVVDRQTYKNLLYLFLAILLGTVYTSLLWVGFVFGAFFSVVLVGFAILIVTVLSSRLFASLERWLANALIGLDLSSYDDVPSSSGGSAWQTVGRYLDAPSTWKGLGFLLLRFWVAIVAFVTIFLLVTAVSLLTTPVRFPHELELFTVNDEPITWTIDTVAEALFAVPLGVALGLVFLHVTNGLAYVSGRMAAALLGEPDSPEDAVPEQPN